MGRGGAAKSSSSAQRSAVSKRPPKATPEAARAQSSLRQRRLRARRKAEKEAAEAPAEERRKALLGQSGGARYGNYHVYENVEWIARIGSRPSASGARAPLAGVISNVACQSTSRWSVELYRWRIYLYILEKEHDVVQSLCDGSVFGMTLNFDETPCRMFSACEFGAHSAPTQVRRAQLHGKDAPTYSFVPRLRRLSGSTWQHLLDAIDVRSLYLPDLCRASFGWQFLLVVVDAAPTNKVVARGLVHYCSEFPRLLVFNAFCMAHVLSNATRWSLGKEFPFGSFVRLSHVMQARPLTKCADFCAGMIGDARIVTTPASEEIGREVWEFVLERFFAPGGPFGNVLSPATIAERVNLCCRLWPNGLPASGERWPVVRGVSIEDYVRCVSILFRRTVNTPLLSRWYTVEQFAWYLLVARAVGVVNYLLPSDLVVGYWPGDNPAARLIDAAAYAAKSNERARRTVEFVKSEDFCYAIFRAAISSIPRWAFARKLCPADDEPPGNRGLNLATRRFADCTNDILCGRHCVVEWLLSREDAHATLRLFVCQALSSSASYMADKLLPYSSLLWRIVRGDVPPERVSDLLEYENCCAENGNEQKVRDALRCLPEDSKTVALAALAQMLRACAFAYTAKGGAVNLTCESQFNHLRSLGLKHPYRPPTISTAGRELVLRHVRELHRLWFKQHVAETYGGMRNMRHLLRRSAPNANGFTVFCRATCVPFYAGKAMWTELAPETKKVWASIAEKMNPDNARARQTALAAAIGRPSVDPLGSAHRWLPISVPDLYERLTDPDCNLRDRWRMKCIREFRQSLEQPQAAPRASPRRLEAIKAVKLPGDQCNSCAANRKVAKWTTNSLFRCVADAFREKNGDRQGMAICIIFADEARYFDICLVVRSPARLLGFGLNPTDWHPPVAGDRAWRPRLAVLALPDVFDGRSRCVLDECAGLGRPEHVVTYEKLGVFATQDGWVCQFGAAAEELVMCPRRAKARGVRPRREPAGGGLDLAAYRRLFGDDVDGGSPSSPRIPSAPDADEDPSPRTDAEDGDVSDIDSGDCCSSNLGRGASSDVDAVRAMRNVGANDVVVDGAGASGGISVDDQAALFEIVRGMIDCDRYGVAIRTHEGIVVTYWKQSEKLRNWSRYVSACRQLQAIPGATHLTSSKSSALCKHSINTCIERARAWQEWHTAWVYGVMPRGELLPGMVLPTTTLTAEHAAPAASGTSASDANSSDGDSIELASGGASSSSVDETSTGSYEGATDVGRTD